MIVQALKNRNVRGLGFNLNIIRSWQSLVVAFLRYRVHNLALFILKRVLALYIQYRLEHDPGGFDLGLVGLLIP